MSVLETYSLSHTDFFGKDFPQTFVNTSGPGTPSGVTAIAVGSQGFAAFWASGLTNGDIMGRVFSSGDTALNPTDFTVNTTTTGLQSAPSAARLTDGRIVVAFSDFGANAAGDIRYRVVSANGAPLLTDVAVKADPVADTEPDVAALADGGWVVTWTNLFATGDRDILAQIYNANGTTRGGRVTVASGTPDQNQSSVAALTGGGFVVGWQDGTGGAAAHFQRFDANGAAQNLQYTDVTGFGTPKDIDLLGLADGGFAFAYVDNGPIYVRILNANGSTRFSVPVSPAGQPFDPHVSQLSNGMLIVDYSDNNGKGYGAIIDPVTGTALATNQVIAGFSPSDTIRQLTVAPTADGRMEMVWRSLIADAGGDGSVLHQTLDVVHRVDGDSLNNVVAGLQTRDEMHGNGGDDTLSGAGGDDLLDGGAGSDTLDGGAGSDIASYAQFGHAVTVNLATGLASDGLDTDTLISIENAIGSNSADIIYGSSGANQVAAGGGNDTVYGAAGADILDGESGADTLFGDDGSDVVHGGIGDDVVVGNAQVFVQEADQLFGDDGNDTIYAENVDQIDGGAGTDSLLAINAYDFTLNMAATSIEYAVMDFGNDTITAATQTTGVSVFASGGNDTVTGSAFVDLIFGGVGNDVISGGDGADAIVGEAGVDQLDGGAGNDRIYFDAQDSLVNGGSGTDAGYITVGTGAGVTIDMAAASLEFLQDTAGGDDTVQGSTMTVGLTAYTGGGADTVTGSGFADVLWGEAGNDSLTGAAGADQLVGGAGADVLSGGTGIDALYGSSGSGGDGAVDTFKFAETGAANADYVFDFVHGTDKLDFTALATSFASVTIANSGGNALVSVGGQLVCSVAGAFATLTSGDFIFSGPETGGPELAPAAPAPGEDAWADDAAAMTAAWRAPLAHPWDAWAVAIA